VFDVVFASCFLCQFPALDRVAREVRRVLKRGGCYVGIEPNPTNPLHLYRYLCRPHSPNQFLLGTRHLAAFEREGFRVSVRFFLARRPSVRSRFLAGCMGIHARLQDEV
jgi:SAM-dependent methyltransferase